MLLGKAIRIMYQSQTLIMAKAFLCAVFLLDSNYIRLTF